MVQAFEGHSGGHRAITDHGNHVVVLPPQIPRDRHAGRS